MESSPEPEARRDRTAERRRLYVFPEPRGVLVVDDEPSVLAVAGAILTRGGLEPYLAPGGIEALAIYREHRASIDLVLLDYTMPKLGGYETLQRLREIDPEVRVLISSGLPKNKVELDGAGFVHKPYRASELIEYLRAALEA